MTGDEVVATFGAHLELDRGMSPHSVRAYTGDVRHLLAYAESRGRTWREVDLPLLRGWLASMVAARLSRATVARRGAAVRSFFGWALDLKATLNRADADVRLRQTEPARIRLVTREPGCDQTITDIT